MTKSVVEVRLSRRNAERLTVAIDAIEAVLGGQLLALALQDENSVWVQLRPGHEANIAEVLKGADWNRVWRLAQEYAE